MTMELDRHVDLAYQRRNEFFGRNGRQNPRHVLDAQRIDADGHLFPGVLDEFFNGVHRAYGIAQRALRVAAVFP